MLSKSLNFMRLVLPLYILNQIYVYTSNSFFITIFIQWYSFIIDSQIDEFLYLNRELTVKQKNYKRKLISELNSQNSINFAIHCKYLYSIKLFTPYKLNSELRFLIDLPEYRQRLYYAIEKKF